MRSKLHQSFYQRDDVVQISKELLGKYLYTNFNGILTGGIITETEAYCGRNDKACHAHSNRRTKRTEVMYQQGGLAYVYLCYGIHHLFNIITNVKDKADAILVRAVEPVEGVDIMMTRRKMNALMPRLSNGPGSMSQALGITTKHYGTTLTGNKIWLEDKGINLKENEIIAGPRIGIDYAEEHALLPWRFRIKGNKWSGKDK